MTIALDAPRFRQNVQRKQTCGDHKPELSTSCSRYWRMVRAVTLDGCAG